MDAEKKETKEINKMSLLIMAVVVLLLIIAGAAYYIFHQNQQMEDLEQAYVLDKESLEKWYVGAHGGFHKMYIVEIENIYSE